MLSQIAIENFRGFRGFEAKFGAVTALLGPNSSGKTTVLHAVRLACELLVRAVESDEPARVAQYGEVSWIDVTANTLLGDISTLLPLSDWQALFVDQDVGEGIKLTIELTFDEDDPLQAIWVEVACARNQQLKLALSVRSSQALLLVAGLPKKSALINGRLTTYLREHAPRAVFIPPFYGVVQTEELRARAAIDRLLGSGDQSHVVRNLVASLDNDRFERLNTFLGDTVGARLSYRTSGDALQSEPALQVRFRDSNGEIELSAAGAGFVNLVALYASLSRWRNESAQRPLIFLLDEPEAHLHPRLQAENASRLAREVTRDFRAQLVMATHSVDILNRLSEEGATLLRCDRNATPSVQALDSDATLFEDLTGWVDLTPYTAINFLAARRVLFVEGTDELALLPRLGELRFRNDPTRLQRFRRWAVVELKGAENAPIARLLGRLVSNDVVRASAKLGRFELIVALDRDFAREPGTSTVHEGGVLLTTIVWSMHSLESMLTTPGVLVRWVRALLGARSPNDLEERVQRAIAVADQDAQLNEDAVARLTTSAVLALQRQGVALGANSGRAVVEATLAAQRQVQADPAAWQRGKDRAARILGSLREGLEPGARAHFPTDICRLIERTELNLVADASLAIPAEINALLEQMAPR